ncbi:MAG: DUF4034 domain-containing protein, partial [Candidatus Obscuribacterales bacterium]|nr:DUF4034 domain-containing protein [Candidatus Obscuribacterales bacterium]
MTSSTDDAQKKRKRSIFIVVLSSVVILTLALIMFVMLTLASSFWSTLYPSVWQKELKSGIGLLESDRRQAKILLEKAFKDAEEGKAPVSEIIAMHRKVSDNYYWSKDYFNGDKEIDKALALVKGEPSVNEANAYAGCYEDKSWMSIHPQYLKDKTLPNGAPEMEKALAIEEKAFGPRSAEAGYKQALLSVVYADSNEKDKAKAALDRAFDIAKKPSNKAMQTWYVWAMAARGQAAQGDFKSAIDSFLTAHHLDPKNKQIQSDLDEGLFLSLKQEVDSSYPELPKLLRKKKFKELEEIAGKLRTQKSSNTEGYWKLDHFYTSLQTARSSSDRAYVDNIELLKEWLKEIPDSATARGILAQLYIDYAWQARGSGYANTVTDEAWKLFRERIELARATLDADPKIKEKCPYSLSVYGTISMAQGWESQDHEKLLKECHKLWPTYSALDL